MSVSDQRVVVGIVGYRCEDVIARLISVGAAWTHKAYEIHVCENGGMDSFRSLVDAISALPTLVSVELPASLSKDVRTRVAFRSLDGQSIVLHGASGNLGYAGGANAILAAVEADPTWYAFWLLNPDTEPEPEALSALLAHLMKGDYAIVGARLVYRGTRRLQQYGGRWRWWLGRGYNVGYGQPMDVRPDIAAVEASLNYASGACMLVSRAFVHHAGPLDERYFLFSEEVDWCLRRGEKRVGYAHEAIVYHTQGATTGANAAIQRRSLFSVYLLERSGILLTRKFRPQFLPIVAVASGVFTLKYLSAGGFAHFKAALAGWAAGLRGETGFPVSFRR